jgi:uncharacterized protein (TIGR02466 family)
MDNLHVLFPTLVYEKTIDEDYSYIEKKLKTKQFDTCKQWRCNMKTSIDNWNLIEDEMFAPLLEKIKKEVSQFSETFGAYGNARAVDGWINISAPGSYQEYHIHTDCHFSVSYYIKSKPDSGNIVFRSHECNSDMFTLPLREFKPASYKTWASAPTPGKLLIFRSNLQHMVEQNRSNEDRISLSANFVIDEEK